MQNITLKTSDGFRLDAEFGQGTTTKGVIFIHGIANDIQREEPFVHAAKELHEQGFSTLLLDLRAHGKSSGESIEDFTISSQLTDIDAAATYLKEHAATTIYLAGASFGAAAIILYAEKYPDAVKGLFLENPVIDYDKAFLHPTTSWGQQYFTNYNNQLEEKGYVAVTSREYKLGPDMFDEMKLYKPFESIRAFTYPVYILHGDRDHILPYQDSLEFFEALENPKKKFTLIPGADHGFHEEPFTTKATEKIVEFFSTL